MTERRSKVYYLIHYYYFIHHGIFFANKYGSVNSITRTAAADFISVSRVANISSWKWCHSSEEINDARTVDANSMSVGEWVGGSKHSSNVLDSSLLRYVATYGMTQYIVPFRQVMAKTHY